MKETKHTKQKRNAQAHSRRDFLKVSAAAGAGLLLPWPTLAQSGGTLSASRIPRFVTPLFIPPRMPETAVGSNTYQIAVRQFRQQILPAGFPDTLVAGYGPVNGLQPFHAPACTIEATVGVPIRVAWINQQVNANGTFQPHILARYLRPTKEWANPPGPIDDFGFGSVGAYRGPVPIVTHFHGGNIHDDADGHPEAWYLPVSTNTPAGFIREGSAYEHFRQKAVARGVPDWPDGAAIFDYQNNQPAAACWYHDHTLGITGENVYTGMAGFYILRGGAYDLPAGVLPAGAFEIPLAIQDRAFNTDGSLLFKDEGNGNIMTVNGNTLPYLVVQKRRYRFRMLNGGNNNTLLLNFSPTVPAHQIGTDIGFLTAPVALNRTFEMGNAERADVIVDFTDVPAGSRVYLQNSGDGPREVMEFRVVPRVGNDLTLPAAGLGALLAAHSEAPPAGFDNLRRVAMKDSRQGIVRPGQVPFLRPLEYHDAPTETPAQGDVELWEMYADEAHPTHLHQVHFWVVNRQRFDPLTGALIGVPSGPPPRERGPKDTVMVHTGEVVRVVTSPFALAGDYVWHCHIIKHEDDGMMRPLVVA
ncbi:MAG: multicopper oxidase domain-containing protein [Verrucomicrobia bacterium]|nr:multicopper oxidase domain-containing protein [Verrucomicrobiota bacterium]